MAREDQIRRIEASKKEKKIDERVTRDMILLLSRSGVIFNEISLVNLKKNLRLNLNSEIVRGAFD